MDCVGLMNMSRVSPTHPAFICSGFSCCCCITDTECLLDTVPLMLMFESLSPVSDTPRATRFLFTDEPAALPPIEWFCFNQMKKNNHCTCIIRVVLRFLLTRTLSSGWSVYGVFDGTSHRFSVSRSILLSQIEFPMDTTTKSSLRLWRRMAVECLSFSKRHWLPFNWLLLE